MPAYTVNTTDYVVGNCMQIILAAAVRDGRHRSSQYSERKVRKVQEECAHQQLIASVTPHLGLGLLQPAQEPKPVQTTPTLIAPMTGGNLVVIAIPSTTRQWNEMVGGDISVLGLPTGRTNRHRPLAIKAEPILIQIKLVPPGSEIELPKNK